MIKRTRILALLMVCIILVLVGCSSSKPSNNSTGNSSNPSNVPPSLPKSVIGGETLQYFGKTADFEYNVYETYIEITRYIGESANVVVPEMIEGLPVKHIGNYSFDCETPPYLNELIETVTLPKSIVVIGENAFENCVTLTSINIPDGVTKIGENAFLNCLSLSSLTIPKSVTKIGEHAFGIEYYFGGIGHGYRLIDVLTVKVYKGSAAMQYLADEPFDINYEIIG